MSTKSATVAQLFWQPRAGEPWRNRSYQCVARVELTTEITSEQVISRDRQILVLIAK